MAVEVLKSRGVPEERIIFLNLIASPEGVNNFATKFPKLRVVTAFIDQVRVHQYLKVVLLVLSYLARQLTSTSCSSRDSMTRSELLQGPLR